MQAAARWAVAANNQLRKRERSPERTQPQYIGRLPKPELWFKNCHCKKLGKKVSYDTANR